MAYQNNIMPLLRRTGVGDIGSGGMPVESVPDMMRQPGGGRLRWLNQSNTMMAGGTDTRGVIQKLKDLLSGSTKQVEEQTTEQTPAQTTPAAETAKPGEPYTFTHGNKTYHRDANNQLWVLDPNGQWRAIAGLWED